MAIKAKILQGPWPEAMKSYPYTLTLHFYAVNDSKNHLDLFIDTNDASLLHYSAPLRPKRNSYLMKKGEPHRRLYLEYQGQISSGRGKVRIIKSSYFLKNFTPHLASKNQARDEITIL